MAMNIQRRTLYVTTLCFISATGPLSLATRLEAVSVSDENLKEKIHHSLAVTLKSITQHHNLDHCKQYKEDLAVIHRAFAPHERASQERTLEHLIDLISKMSDQPSVTKSTDFSDAIEATIRTELTTIITNNVSAGNMTVFDALWFRCSKKKLEAIVPKLPAIVTRALDELQHAPITLDDIADALREARKTYLQDAHELLGELGLGEIKKKTVTPTANAITLANAIAGRREFAILRTLLAFISLAALVLPNNQALDPNVLVSRLAPVMNIHLEAALVKALAYELDEAELQFLNDFLNHNSYRTVVKDWSSIWDALLKTIQQLQRK